MATALELTTAEDRSTVDALTAELVEFEAAPARRRHLGQAVAIYCRWLEAQSDVSAATSDAYDRDVRSFADAMSASGVRLLAEVEGKHVDLWKLRLSKLEPSTVHRKLTAVSRFFAWCLRWGLVSRNPVDTVDRPRKPRKEAPYLTLEHYHALEGVCRNAKERAVLGCLYWGGLRRNEVVGLTIGAVDLGARRIRVTGKGGHERIVAACHNLARLLDDHLTTLDTSEPGTPLFRNGRASGLSNKNVNNWFSRWVREAGLEGHGYTPHSARHGAGTLLGLSGLTGPAICKQLGHADQRTVLGYVHLTPESIRDKLDEIDAFGRGPDGPSGGDIGDVRRELGELRSMLGELLGRKRGDTEE